jgi:hypothetical protein
VEPRCKCGAAQDPARDGFCSGGHPLPGHGGKLSTKHGLYAARPFDVAVPVTTTAQVLAQLREAIGRDVARYADASRTHRLNARDQAYVLNAVDRLRDIDARLREFDAASAPSEAPAAAGDEAARWQAAAQLFAQHPDDCLDFLRLVLEADRERVGPLRAALWQLLEHFDPKGVPVWRGHKAEDPDEMLL